MRATLLDLGRSSQTRVIRQFEPIFYDGLGHEVAGCARLPVFLNGAQVSGPTARRGLGSFEGWMAARVTQGRACSDLFADRDRRRPVVWALFGAPNHASRTGPPIGHRQL